MNRQEFYQWFKHFRACYPGVIAWLGKFPEAKDERRPMEPTQGEIVTQWEHALASADLKHATEAVSRCHRGDEEQPNSFDLWPQQVRKIASRLARETNFTAPRQYDTPEPRYYCPYCKDTGNVYIIGAKMMRVLSHKDAFPTELPEGWYQWYLHDPAAQQIRIELGILGKYAEESIPCNCSKAPRRKEGGLVYDPEKFCQFDWLNPDASIEWYNRKATDPARLARAIGSKFTTVTAEDLF